MTNGQNELEESIYNSPACAPCSGWVERRCGDCPTDQPWPPSLKRLSVTAMIVANELHQAVTQLDLSENDVQHQIYVERIKQAIRQWIDLGDKLHDGCC